METKEINKERVKETLQKIINLFEKGNLPEVITIATFPPYEVPSNKWSLTNRLIMLLNSSSDARGWKQWQEVSRCIKKGEKAFYILAPRIIARKEAEPEKEDKKEYLLIGFIPIPVFGAEQTEGADLEYEKMKLPEFPLLKKAQEWGIDVKGIAFQGNYYGYYHNREQTEKIRLATPHEKTFFHELSHAAHYRVNGAIRPGQDAKQEIVAELSAQVLSQMVGTEIESTLGNSFEYIKRYSEKIKKDVAKACLSVLSDVEKVLHLILETDLKSDSMVCS